MAKSQAAQLCCSVKSDRCCIVVRPTYHPCHTYMLLTKFHPHSLWANINFSKTFLCSYFILCFENNQPNVQVLLDWNIALSNWHEARCGWLYVRPNTNIAALCPLWTSGRVPAGSEIYWWCDFFLSVFCYSSTHAQTKRGGHVRQNWRVPQQPKVRKLTVILFAKKPEGIFTVNILKQFPSKWKLDSFAKSIKCIF